MSHSRFKIEKVQEIRCEKFTKTTDYFPDLWRNLAECENEKYEPVRSRTFEFAIDFKQPL